MRLYPESALSQLEFDKVKSLLKEQCKTEYGIEKAAALSINTDLAIIELALHQTQEFKLLLQQSQYFPNVFVLNISKELKLLGIPGATLAGEQFLHIKKLAENISNVFRWFDAEKKIAYPSLTKVIEHTYYEKLIVNSIDEVLDELGVVKDNASDALQKIRMNLYRKRNELRRMFEKVLAKLAKAGYSADIEESFSSGRRVVAVFA